MLTSAPNFKFIPTPMITIISESANSKTRQVHKGAWKNYYAYELYPDQ